MSFLNYFPEVVKCWFSFYLSSLQKNKPFFMFLLIVLLSNDASPQTAK